MTALARRSCPPWEMKGTTSSSPSLAASHPRAFRRNCHLRAMQAPRLARHLKTAYAIFRSTKTTTRSSFESHSGPVSSPRRASGTRGAFAPQIPSFECHLWMWLVQVRVVGPVPEPSDPLGPLQATTRTAAFPGEGAFHPQEVQPNEKNEGLRLLRRAF